MVVCSNLFQSGPKTGNQHSHAATEEKVCECSLSSVDFPETVSHLSAPNKSVCVCDRADLFLEQLLRSYTATLMLLHKHRPNAHSLAAYPALPAD